MKTIRPIIAGLLGVIALHAHGFDPSDSNRVLVVWNTAWTADNDGDGTQDAQQIKDAYVALRAIPTANVLGIPTQTGLAYAKHTNFYAEIVAPITNKLANLGPSSIDVILMIDGLPIFTPTSNIYISVDNTLMNLESIDPLVSSLGRQAFSYLEPTPTINTDNAHFDHTLYKNAGKNVYMVCRLSAPNAPRGVLNQLEQVRYAERYVATNGINGPVYIDSRWGPYTDIELSTHTNVTSGNYIQLAYGDRNIAYAEHYVTNGLELAWENTGTDFEIGEAGAAFTFATNAFLYGGWYNYSRYLDAFDWLPGSVGCDLNSNSARGMRDGNFWVGGAFQQGLTCASGVLGEPYLDGHARPNVLLYYLLQGYTFAEASHLATPYLDWMCVNLGDPLYAPLREKTVAIDTTAPVFITGFPHVTNVTLTSAAFPFKISSTTTNPETARATISYGLTPACTETNSSLLGYWYWNLPSITNLLSGTTYYYRVTLTDPAGNSTNSSLATFETPPEISLTPSGSNSTHLLSWPSTSNKTYSLTYATNLLAPFSVIAPNLPATPPINIYTNTPSSLPPHYYQLILHP